MAALGVALMCSVSVTSPSVAAQGETTVTSKVESAASNLAVTRPMSFYDQNKILIWSVVAVILPLIALLSALAVWSWRLGRNARESVRTLKESHRRLVDFLEHMPAGAIHLDGDDMGINRAAETITGHSRSELVTLDAWLQALFRDRWQDARELYDTRRKAAYPHSGEVSVFHGDGGERRIEFFGYAYGEQAIWLFNDVTERLCAEREMRSSEARLAAIIETALVGIITIDDRGLIQSFSRAAEEMFGYSAPDLIGKNMSILMSPPFREDLDHHLSRHRMTGEEKITGAGRELDAQRKDGSIFPIFLSVGKIIMEDEPQILVGIIHDITQQRDAQLRAERLREELLHVARIAEIGALTTDLAHEINQPLGAMKNYVEASIDLLADPRAIMSGQILELMNKAVGQADRASGIVHRLRKFVERGENLRTLEHLNSIVEEALELIESAASRQKIKVRLEMGQDLPKVLADKLQIQQVLLNLMKNAMDALSGLPNGEIEVATTLRDAAFVEVAVRDNGTGVATEIAETLFRPYVTTKAHGVGVGLSICRSIVEAHGGRLWAEPGHARGALFRFTLPVADSGLE